MTVCGTLGRYTNGRCRCAACRAANADYAAKSRVRLAGRPMADVPHGTAGGYSNWSCRCDDCSAAHRVKMVADYRRRKAAKAALVPAGVASPGGVVSRSERHPLAVTADTTRRPGGGAAYATARSAHDLPCS